MKRKIKTNPLFVHISRRTFLKSAVYIPIACSVCSIPAYASQNLLQEVKYYKKLENNTIKCKTCPKECEVKTSARGFCNNKENRGGKYYSLVYGQACAMNIDPIEKKPFFHFLPGSKSFSIATAGCNFSCKYCQNWQISQAKPEQVQTKHLPPKQIINVAKNYKCEVIAYTYTEPIAFYDYMLDIAKLSREAGIHSVMVSNGFINPDPLKELCQYLSAIKIDFKGFSEKFYKEICSGSLKPVLRTLKLLKETGIWFELVNLVIPTLNDRHLQIKVMCEWIKNELGNNVPIHFSRFNPTYLLKNLPPTPVETLEMAMDIAIKTGLNYVYIGNVPGHNGENTYCPSCKSLVIQRLGYTLIKNSLLNGRCNHCKQPIAGVWG